MNFRPNDASSENCEKVDIRKSSEHQATKLKAPKRTAYGVMKYPGSKTTTMQHGHSPYGRDKIPSSQISNIGKNKTTGLVKASENVVNQSIKSNVATKPPLKSSVPRTGSSDNNTNGEQKPVRRQIIPNAGSKLKLPRPNSFAGPKTQGLMQPKAGIKAGSNPATSASTLSKSKSLQTLPQAIKGRGAKKESVIPKSASQDNMLRPTGMSIKPRSIPKSLSQDNIVRSASAPLKQMPKRRSSETLTKPNGFKPPKPGFHGNFTRPRVSTLSSTLNTTVNISTPCYVKQSNKKLKDLQISPIITCDDNNDPECTFDVTHGMDVCDMKPPKDLIEENNNALSTGDLNVTYNPEKMITQTVDTTSEQQIINVQKGFTKPNINDSDVVLNETCAQDGSINVSTTPELSASRECLNKTHVCLDKTHIIDGTNSDAFLKEVCVTDGSMDKLNDSNSNLLNETRVLDGTRSAVNNCTAALNETHVLDRTRSGVNNCTAALNETHVLDRTRSGVNNCTAALNETHVITNLNDLNETVNLHDVHSRDNRLFTDSDFLENVVMPQFNLDDTPLKVNNFSHKESFSEDILKVLEAIICTSNNNNTSSDAVFVSTSPMKQQINDIEKDDVSMENLDNESDRMNFIDSHFGSIPTHREGTPLSIELKHTEGTPLSIELKNADDTDIQTSHSVPPFTPPTTPTSLGSRCNTISVSRGEWKDRGLGVRLTRRNTFASQDFSSKFRFPKQMNAMESLEGNILMDNTSFLHLSNDVRSMKTQLLRLKRTLLEVCV